MEKNDGKSKKGDEGETTSVTPFRPEYVPAEQNLETIGYFAAGYKRKYPTAEQKSNLIILSHDRKIEIIPTAKYGYPNSDDLDFYRGFLKICHEQTTVVERSDNGRLSFHPHLPLPIGFFSRQLIRNAGRTESARERQAVRDWISRLTFTGIEGKLYRAKTKQFDAVFGGSLFIQFILVGEKMRNGKIADRNYVWLAAWFLSNYYYHYYHPVDLAFHRRLHKAIAKVLYPLLDTGWYASRGKPYVKRYVDLCSLLFIPSHKQLSLVKQQLDPSHEELTRERFLASWEYKLDRHGKWSGVIRWSPGEKWFQDQEERKPRKGHAERSDHSLVLPVSILLPEKTEIPPQIPLSRSTPAVRSSLNRDRDRYVELVKDFYSRVGQPRISRAKLDRGRDLLVTLTDADGRHFTSEELATALAWIVSHKEDRFDGKVYSLNLLPEVIGEALQGGERAKKVEQERQRQQAEGERLTAEHERRQKLEARYRSLPIDEQTSLRERAKDNLLRQGMARRLLLETLVMGEICRLLEEQEKLRELE